MMTSVPRRFSCFLKFILKWFKESEMFLSHYINLLRYWSSQSGHWKRESGFIGGLVCVFLTGMHVPSIYAALTFLSCNFYIFQFIIYSYFTWFTLKFLVPRSFLYAWLFLRILCSKFIGSLWGPYPTKGRYPFPFPQVKTWFEIDVLDDPLRPIEWLATKRGWVSYFPFYRLALFVYLCWHYGDFFISLVIHLGCLWQYPWVFVVGLLSFWPTPDSSLPFIIFMDLASPFFVLLQGFVDPFCSQNFSVDYLWLIMHVVVLQLEVD